MIPTLYPIMGERKIEVKNYDSHYQTYCVVITDLPSGVKLRFGQNEIEKILEIVNKQLKEFRKVLKRRT